MIDFAPLYRSAIGFDRLTDLLDGSRTDNRPGYPPYNIEVAGEDRYRITMAVAGFTQSELDIEVELDGLKVVGKKGRDEASATNYLHRGIATRDFEHRFQLAEHVKVVGAQLANGLLSIDLVREIPETMKPRRIAIHGGNVEMLNRNTA